MLGCVIGQDWNGPTAQAHCLAGCHGQPRPGLSWFWKLFSFLSSATFLQDCHGKLPSHTSGIVGECNDQTLGWGRTIILGKLELLSIHSTVFHDYPLWSHFTQEGIIQSKPSHKETTVLSFKKKGQDNRHKTGFERQLKPVFTSTETKEALTWEEWWGKRGTGVMWGPPGLSPSVSLVGWGRGEKFY